jgi:hypothetical protein
MLALKVKLLLNWNIHTVLLSDYAGGISEGKGISDVFIDIKNTESILPHMGMRNIA